MKYFFSVIFALLLFGCKTDTLPQEHLLKDGDIIFQTSLSNQSKAIQAATKSIYSHCGIIYQTDGVFFVYEALQPVQTTPLENFINRGKNSHYVIKRLKNADTLLRKSVVAKMKEASQKYSSKNYDLYFEWSNDRIYCSELIWKIYKEGTGIEIGKLQKLSDFDLSNPVVQQKLKERYGNKIPLNEKVISPATIFNSELLYTVSEN